MTSLLDVNVLISLLDANHEHHPAVMGWFGQNNDRWASCPTTQNGYLRIVTLERYGNTISINEAIRRLSRAVSTPDHDFLSDNISLLNPSMSRTGTSKDPSSSPTYTCLRCRFRMVRGS